MTGPDEDDVLPERSSDEQDSGWGDAPDDEDADERRLRAERPPHHDRG